MKELVLTCPFTGVSFKALLSSDNNIYYINPLTGKQMTAKLETLESTITLAIEDFAYVESVSPKDAQEILDVSKQRISQIVASNIIPVRIVSGSPRFLKEDVLRYKESRSVGAPKKEK